MNDCFIPLSLEIICYATIVTGTASIPLTEICVVMTEEGNLAYGTENV